MEGWRILYRFLIYLNKLKLLHISLKGKSEPKLDLDLALDLKYYWNSDHDFNLSPLNGIAEQSSLGMSIHPSTLTPREPRVESGQAKQVNLSSSSQDCEYEVDCLKASQTVIEEIIKDVVAICENRSC